MVTPKRRPVPSVQTGFFKPHGTVHLKQTGLLNVLVATGPFNREMIAASDIALEAEYEALAKKGRWGTILVFRDSAMTSLDALEEITKVVRLRKTQGLSPVALALVFGDGVEGKNLMKPLYLNAYQAGGLECKMFDREDLAAQWINGILSAS